MIWHQNIFDTWPFENNSIQAIITSPPYWALRKYNIPDVLIGGDKNCNHDFNVTHRPLRDKSGMPSNNSILAVKHVEAVESTRNIFYGICNKCGCWKGQYGIESNFIGEHSYLEHTKLWMQEAIRCLKDDGILFVNVGDSYGTVSGTMGKGKWKSPKLSDDANESMPEKPNINRHKCKCLIPERVAIMAVDELNLICRNIIIWHKVNHLPESVGDRFTKSYEHILMLVKNQKYQFFLDPIREPHKQVSIDRLKRGISKNNKWVDGADGQTRHGLSQPRPNTAIKEEDDADNNENLFDENTFDTLNTDNNNDVNTGENNAEPCKDKNPSDYYRDSVDDVFEIATQPSSERHFAMFPEKLIRRLILCSTKIGDVVLDPFAGSGTTLKVAEELNRIGYGIDMGYQDIQNRRLTNIQKELPWE